MKLRSNNSKASDQYPTPNTLRSANPTAVHVRKRLMPATPTLERTEPSQSRDQSAFSRPSECKNKDVLGRTPKASLRRTPSARPTTPKANSDQDPDALRLDAEMPVTTSTLVAQASKLDSQKNE